MRLLKQSAAYDLMLFLADDADHVTGKTGLTLTVTASKAGGAFGSISPTVTERGDGWYSVALTASHTDTLGDLVVRATASGADPAEAVCQVRANVLGDTLPANTVQIEGADATDTLDARIDARLTAYNVSTYDGSDTAGTTELLARVGEPSDLDEAGETLSDNLWALHALASAVAADVGNLSGDLASVAADVGTVHARTGRLDTAVEEVGETGTYRFTAAALGLAPSGDDAAAVYAHFTSDGREEAFHADVSALALEASVQALGSPLQADDYVPPVDVSADTAALLAYAERLDALLEDAGGDRFTAKSLEAAPAGGGGGTDWTEQEREQIRHRLGIDGDAEAPAATPSLATAAVAAAIKAKTDLIGAAGVTVSAPVRPDGVTVELIQGYDYQAPEGRRLTWTSAQWPDLTGCAVDLVTDRGDEIEGVLVAAGGSPQAVGVDLTAEASAALARGPVGYQLRATHPNGHQTPLLPPGAVLDVSGL